MPLYNNEQLDDQLTYDASVSFAGGMVSAIRANLLQSDQAQLIQNCEIDRVGRARTRAGTLTTGSPGGAHPIQGLFYYDTPNLKRLIAAANNVLYQFDNTTWTNLPGYTPAAGSNVQMAQLIDKIYVLDGTQNLYQWDGTTWIQQIPSMNGTTTIGTANLTNLTSTAAIQPGCIVSGSGIPNATTVLSITNSTTVVMSANATASGTGPVTFGNTLPAGCSILTQHTNRLFASGRTQQGYTDTIYVSDLLNGLNWQQPQFSFRVGGGEGQPVVGLCTFQGTQLAVFKTSSIYLVNADPTQNTAANWQINAVSLSFGCVNQRTIVPVGQDIYFLAHDGVRTVSQTLVQNQTNVSDPLSAPIQDYMDRINWNAISQACGIWYHNLYLLAVPLDSSTTTNYILVYNTLLKSWSGFWTGLSPVQFAVTRFSGLKRLLIAQSTGDISTWLDHVPEATRIPANYTDSGTNYTTRITTRNMTFEETMSPKLGYSCEGEFAYSQIAWQSLLINVVLDDAPAVNAVQGAIVGVVNQIPLNLPFSLYLPTVQRLTFDLSQYGPFREIAIDIQCSNGYVYYRGVNLSAFIDTFHEETAT